MRKTAFTLLAASLAMSTGCTFAGGALIGNQLWGDQRIGEVEPGFSGFTGTSLVCLGTDAELSDDERDAGVFEINAARVLGTFSTGDRRFDDNVVSCWTEPEYVFEVEDADGNTWQVGYAWMDGEGWDMTPWVNAREGSRVDVLVRSEPGTEAAGFVVSRNDKLLYVLESGRGDRGFREDDIPGLRVDRAENIGTIDRGCGEGTTFSIELESDSDRLVLYPGEDTGFETGGESMTVCSIEAVEFEDDCATSELSYVMFR